MPSSLAYTRKFIILKKEFSTLMGINPKGHCKLEMKGIRGMVTVNIENAEVDSVYDVVFVSKDKINTKWNLGKIFTDSIGRGRSECAFILRELESKNFSIDKVSAILIMKEEDILLAGYIEQEDGTIERYIESMPIKPYDEITQDIIPEVQEEIIEDTIEEPINNPVYEPMEEQILLEEPVEEIAEDLIEWPEEVIEDQIQKMANEELQYENPKLAEKHDDESMELDYKALDYLKKLNQKNQTTNYVLSILRFFPYIDPFKYNLKGHNWWIMDLDVENEYRAFLPYFSYITGGNNKEPFINSTTCNQLMNKYGHYLFGLYNEGETVKYFVYGIPGQFIQDEHPYNGINGFNTWYQGKNIEGYWIIYIDPMTGKPVYPQIPMIPMD